MGLGEAIILKNKKGDFFGSVRGGRILVDESGPSPVLSPHRTSRTIISFLKNKYTTIYFMTIS